MINCLYCKSDRLFHRDSDNYGDFCYPQLFFCAKCEKEFWVVLSGSGQQAPITIEYRLLAVKRKKVKITDRTRGFMLVEPESMRDWLKINSQQDDNVPMANNTCQWRCESGGRCGQPVKTRPGTKYDDCFCPYHRTMFNEKCRTGAGIENILYAERARIAQEETNEHS